MPPEKLGACWALRAIPAALENTGLTAGIAGICGMMEVAVWQSELNVPENMLGIEGKAKGWKPKACFCSPIALPIPIPVASLKAAFMPPVATEDNAAVLETDAGGPKPTASSVSETKVSLANSLAIFTPSRASGLFAIRENAVAHISVKAASAPNAAAARAPKVAISNPQKISFTNVLTNYFCISSLYLFTSETSEWCWVEHFIDELCHKVIQFRSKGVVMKLLVLIITIASLSTPNVVFAGKKSHVHKKQDHAETAQPEVAAPSAAAPPAAEQPSPAATPPITAPRAAPPSAADIRPNQEQKPFRDRNGRYYEQRGVDQFDRQERRQRNYDRQQGGSSEYKRQERRHRNDEQYQDNQEYRHHHRDRDDNHRGNIVIPIRDILPW